MRQLFASRKPPAFTSLTMEMKNYNTHRQDQNFVLLYNMVRIANFHMLLVAQKQYASRRIKNALKSWTLQF